MLFAVGDIHGCFSQLTRLIDRCKDLAGNSPARFVFLGDYIDRGPQSREVVSFLMAMQAQAPGDVICLAGNHEDFLNFMDSPDQMANWLANGGDSTLRSYGIASPQEFPPAHLTWLQSLPTHYDDGLHFFVHAGVNPKRPLDQQNRDDMLWIRKPFHRSTVDFGRLIVHGHEPTLDGAPDIHPNRIIVDTGATYGQALTAAVFQDAIREPVEFLQISSPISLV